MLHLLVASFRALPLDLMLPVSRRGFVWIWSWIFFFSPPFLFFSRCLSLFFFFLSRGFFSIQTRYLSSIVSLGAPSHMRTPPRGLPAASARKSLGRCVSLETRPGPGRVQDGRVAADMCPCASTFRMISARESGPRRNKRKEKRKKKRRRRKKKKETLDGVGASDSLACSCSFHTRDNVVIEMLPVQVGLQSQNKAICFSRVNPDGGAGITFFRND